MALRHTFLIMLVVSLSACTTNDSKQVDWPVYRGDLSATQYAHLDQINTTNVHLLEPAWTFKMGDDELHTVECNPLIIDGVMYLTTHELDLVALDAATGEEIWRFIPWDNRATRRDGYRVNRGLAFWKEGDDRRLLYVAGHRLYAVNAGNGGPVMEFGEEGSIDFTQGLGRDVNGMPVAATTPGVVFEDIIVMGSSVYDGQGQVNPPGHIRAYSVRTGEQIWRFNTVPHPGEYGYDTWPDSDAWETAGGANAWGGFTLDPENEIVYTGTGSPDADHYGWKREGANLFGNSILALHVRTGERIWHYQTVHHDLWDYDLPVAPTLGELTIDGQRRHAAIQITKQGFVFVLDRFTGEPLFPVEERPVPQSDIPGEQTWPTQPFPTKPPAYADQGFAEDDITDLNPEAHAYVKETYFDRFGPAPLFPPPSEKGDFIVPQFNGGTDWGGASFDASTGILYVNTSNEPESLTMRRIDPAEGRPYLWRDTGHAEIYDPEGFPISKRPWGTLNAIDLNAGEILWQVPLGTYPELEARGYPPTGTFNMGGPVATDGGLVFIAATRDERIRAFDKETGKVLWEYQLPFGGYATPSVYMVNGRQYVVIAASGGGKAGTKQGDVYMAFALPE